MQGRHTDRYHGRVEPLDAATGGPTPAAMAVAALSRTSQAIHKSSSIKQFKGVVSSLRLVYLKTCEAVRRIDLSTEPSGSECTRLRHPPVTS